MIPLTDEENESYKKYNKVRDHCHCKGNIEERLIVFVI